MGHLVSCHLPGVDGSDSSQLDFCELQELENHIPGPSKGCPMDYPTLPIEASRQGTPTGGSW